MYAVIDTRTQTPQDVGHIVSKHRLFRQAVKAVAVLCESGLPNQRQVFPTVWRVKPVAVPGMGIPFADVDWCEPLAVEIYAKLEAMVKVHRQAIRDKAKAAGAKPKREYLRKYMGTDGVLYKQCKGCRRDLPLSYFYAAVLSPWVSSKCKDCDNQRRR
jgi:hypothetical protein